MKILVTAASRHGATFEIARRIAETLVAAGFETEVSPPEDVHSVAPYDGVVIGSGVYAGRWLRPARDLINREAVALSTKPVWLFSSGPLGDPPKPEGDPAETVGFREATHAIEHRVFPGRAALDGLGMAEKVIFRVVHAPEGDFRAWDDVEAWAAEIAATLGARRHVLDPQLAATT